MSKRKSRGWVPPGYRYLGPGNDLHRGPPENESDKAAQKHDWKYHFMEQQNKRPRWIYSNADDDFIDEVKGEDWKARTAKWIFEKKRKLAETGWLEDARTQPKSSRYEDFMKVISQFSRKRKREDDEDSISTQDTQQSNITEDTVVENGNEDMSGKMNATGSGNENGLSETKIDRVDPHKVFRGPPDYTFASLPWQYDAQVIDRETIARDHTFRMTSPYDPLNTISYQDLNAGLGTMGYRGPVPDVSDATVRSANWWSYYSGLYKYYSTISCQYSVFIENYGEPIWVYFMFINDEVPPGTADNQDMQLWNNVEYHYVNSPYMGLTSSGGNVEGFINGVPDATQPQENDTDMTIDTLPHATQLFQTGENIQTRSGTTTLQKFGKYTPGDYNREIRLDSDVENWTATNANPKLPEKLVIRVKPQSNILESNSVRSAGDDTKYRIRVQINYLVEFKELDYKIRFPVVTQPITITLSDAQVGVS